MTSTPEDRLPEDEDDSIVDESLLDEDPEDADDDGDEGDEDEDGEDGKKAKAAVEEEEEEVVHRDTPVPSNDEIEAGMRWAFDGEEIEPELLELYIRHAVLVMDENSRQNLTAIVDPKEVAAKHYLDCWRVTRLLPLMGRHVMDIGTGAGFPGIPVAAAEDMCKVSLIDSTKKRIDFVQRCIDELKIPNAKAFWIRGEEHLARNPCDIVMMRAVSSVRENVRTLRKVRHSHKDLVMFKGNSWSREVRAGEREAERLGYKLNTVWEHELPGEMGGRAILVYTAPGGAGM